MDSGRYRFNRRCLLQIALCDSVGGTSVESLYDVAEHFAIIFVLERQMKLQHSCFRALTTLSLWYEYNSVWYLRLQHEYYHCTAQKLVLAVNCDDNAVFFVD